MGTADYVQAKAIRQPAPKGPDGNDADVWVGTVREDEQNRSFVTLEIKPAYGSLAVVRLSLVELRDLSDLILKRLGAREGRQVPVEVTVPVGALIKVTYLSAE